MQVLDHEPNSWFLFASGGALLLDAACNHSAFGYSWLIELSAAERRAFALHGRAYLDRLARHIQYGAPILKISRSPYKDRDRSGDFGDETARAIAAWRSTVASAG